MFTKGDICIVNQEANNLLSGIYRSLIGKQVMITSEDVYINKYPVRVINPNKENPWESSEQLYIRADCLTKEG